MAYTKNSIPVGDWLAKEIRASSVTVGTTPTALPATALADRRYLLIYNNSSATIYVGHSTVTTGTGIPIIAKASLSLSLDAGVILYGIEATGSRNVRVLEGA